jgi:hypothetical protein
VRVPWPIVSFAKPEFITVAIGDGVVYVRDLEECGAPVFSR